MRALRRVLPDAGQRVHDARPRLAGRRTQDRADQEAKHADHEQHRDGDGAKRMVHRRRLPRRRRRAVRCLAPEREQVHFTPGAHTAWHTHPNGQTIYVLEGVGHAQRRGGPIEVIRPGDRVFFEPGEEHWHGATATRFMTHIAMVEVDEEGPVRPGATTSPMRSTGRRRRTARVMQRGGLDAEAVEAPRLLSDCHIWSTCIQGELDPSSHPHEMSGAAHACNR